MRSAGIFLFSLKPLLSIIAPSIFSDFAYTITDTADTAYTGFRRSQVRSRAANIFFFRSFSSVLSKQ